MMSNIIDEKKPQNFDEALELECEKTNINDMKLYINENKKFWDSFPMPKTKGYFLVERTQRLTFMKHAVGVGSALLNRSLGYSPLYITPGMPIEFYQSYVSSASIVDAELTNFTQWKISYFIKKIYKSLKKPEDILNIKYDNILYGDIIYDVYLAQEELATIKEIDIKIKQLMKDLFIYHEQVKQIIKKYNVKAVLTTHQININSSPLHRLAQKYKLKDFMFNTPEERLLMYRADLVKDFQYTPTKDKIDEILNLSEEKFLETFNVIKEKHFAGSNLDAKMAFSSCNKILYSKEEFCKNYNLDPNKKNVLVMLHAFNDHPHSHFDGMIFKDYYDWFEQTLKYANTNNNVNWIFKRHPSDSRYICKDVNYGNLFKNKSNNIIFFDLIDKIDTRSLEYIADVVITCCGSCGFEMPAFYGLPVITAADNNYKGFGFTNEPRTKDEYFKLLKNVQNLKPLNEEQIKIARAVYMFIYHYSLIDTKIAPSWTYDNALNLTTARWNLKYILDRYSKYNSEIKDQVKIIIEKMSSPDFKTYRKDIK